MAKHLWENHFSPVRPCCPCQAARLQAGLTSWPHVPIEGLGSVLLCAAAARWCWQSSGRGVEPQVERVVPDRQGRMLGRGHDPAQPARGQ